MKIAALVSVSLLLAAQDPAPPKPGKEHELLRRFEGDWDVTTKFAMAPATGKLLQMKMVHEIKDKDLRVLSFFMPGPDGKGFQTGTIEYRRKN
jgi:hypothetical protein